MRLTTVTTRADLLLLTADDFADVPRPIGTVRLPTVFSPNRAEYRREVARALGSAKLRAGRRGRAADRCPTGRTRSSPTPTCASGCGPPARPSASSASSSSSTSRVDGHSQSLAREFDHVLDVLDRRGLRRRRRRGR